MFLSNHDGFREFHDHLIRPLGKLHKKLNIWMNLVHKGGRGFSPTPSFHVCFFTFNVKNMFLKNWKTTIKQW